MIEEALVLILTLLGAAVLLRGRVYLRNAAQRGTVQSGWVPDAWPSPASTSSETCGVEANHRKERIYDV